MFSVSFACSSTASGTGPSCQYTTEHSNVGLGHLYGTQYEVAVKKLPMQVQSVATAQPGAAAAGLDASVPGMSDLLALCCVPFALSRTYFVPVCGALGKVVSTI